MVLKDVLLQRPTTISDGSQDRKLVPSSKSVQERLGEQSEEDGN